jgi:hypothetical protein
VIGQSGHLDPYIDVSEADEILEQNEDETSIEVIQQTYQAYFIDGSDEFNPTLFRFLLRRLGKQADMFAAAHSLSLLEPHPEETENNSTIGAQCLPWKNGKLK